MTIEIIPAGKDVRIVDASGNAVSIDDTGQMHVVAAGIQDTGNSSTTPLSASATYTGTAINILGYNAISIFVTSDADGTLYVDYSVDGSTNWRTAETYPILADAEKWFTPPAFGKWFRLRYVNGAADQTNFEITTTLRKLPIKWSSHNIEEPIADQDDAELVKSVLTAKKDSGDFSNIGATESGNLRTTDAENGLAIAKGDVTGTGFTHKFGNAPDFDTSDNEVTIWDGANDSDIDEMQYNYSTTADIDSISSSNNSDTVDIEIQGLDTDYALTTQTITLTGQTRAALTTNLIRVFRMKNVGATDLAGNAYCYVNTALSAGVPSDTTKVRAVIENGNNQTEMALYTVPAGKTAYMRSWFASSAGARKTTNYIVRMRARPFGQVFQLKHRTAISDGKPYNHPYDEPEKFSEKTDIAMTAQATAVGITEAAVAAGFDIVLIDN